MPKYSDLVSALQIFISAHGDQMLGGADHDILYGPDSNIELTDPQREELEKLGWFIDDSMDSWVKFV
jgi:hypothetical protein